MELINFADLSFEEWNRENPRGGMLDKFVKVSLTLNGIEYDITHCVIKAYELQTPRKGSKDHKKVIVNYNCLGFHLSDYVKEQIKKDEGPLVDELIKFFDER